MTNFSKAQPSVPVTTIAYEKFQGLDTTRDEQSLEIPKAQPLSSLVNAHCDWSGQIVRDGGAVKAADGGIVDHVTFLDKNTLVWAESNDAYVSLVSQLGHRLDDIYPASAVVCSTLYARRLHVFSAGHPVRIYDGAVWRDTNSMSEFRPGFGVTLSQRLAMAGDPRQPTRIELSRVNDGEILSDEETPDNEEVTRASYIDIANLVGAAEEITGLGVFEMNRLAIFTQDRAILFIIDPDLSVWQIDERAQINVGTVSHNTVVNAGGDILFCARDGVHAIRRNIDNGVMVVSVPMSERVSLLYRRLLRQVSDPARISACFDQDSRQYHVFFPVYGSNLTTRLTLTLNPFQTEKSTWSTGDFLSARCGVSLGGRQVWGTAGGLYDIAAVDAIADALPSATVTTPILWHGDIENTKQSHSIIFMASGSGQILVEGFDEEGRALSSFTIDVSESGDDLFPRIPLSQQHVRRFEHRYRGLQLRFTITGTGLIRIVGFVVKIKRSP